MHFDALFLMLGVAHFAMPLIYYAYLMRQLRKSWNIKMDPSYAPSVTVVIPTYNEEALIEQRLSNIEAQEYPKERMKVMVIDSASTDHTVKIARNWSARNQSIVVEVVEESVRRGKACALNTALKHASEDILIIGEADSLWAKNALKEMLKYFSDQSIGAVTAIKEPVKANPSDATIESAYRSFYNSVRIAESKIHGTPIFHGELSAFRRDLLVKIGGFPIEVGADDSHTATLISLRGQRVIAVPESVAYEVVPSSLRGYATWRTRRAKHLVHHFLKAMKKISEAPRDFKKVLAVEFFLHVVNPWLLLMMLVAFIASIATEGLSFLNMTVILAVFAVFLVKRTRELFLMWVMNQLILIYSAIAGIWSKELIWRKIRS